MANIGEADVGGLLPNADRGVEISRRFKPTSGREPDGFHELDRGLLPIELCVGRGCTLGGTPRILPAHRPVTRTSSGRRTQL